MKQKEKILWSMSTTVREANRIKGFLKVAKKIEGRTWDYDAQADFQIMLVQYHEYLNDPTNGQTFQKLDAKQIKWLCDFENVIPYDVAKGIILAKNYTGGPEMRGRQSLSPLVKLGLVYKDEQNKVVISDLGNKYINDEITDEEFFIDSLVKLEYPNPIDKDNVDRNIKPFIAILHLIDKVNKLCVKNGMKPKGVSNDEFGIFCLSIYDYKQIDNYAEKIIEYRRNVESLSSYDEREEYRLDYIANFLPDYKNPENNCAEYADNMIRYLRQTKLLYIRGKYDNKYVDLEPRRMIEITSLLAGDSAKPRGFTNTQDWIDYYSVYGTYDLPYETIEQLKKILVQIDTDNVKLAQKHSVSYQKATLTDDKKILKNAIILAREERTKLQNIELKEAYFNVDRINEAQEMLTAISTHDKAKLTYKPSIEFEKWANIALNIINDSELIKPNTKVGDDNEPIDTAPGGMADIECYYKDFNMVCEVTTLTSRDQWYNEGQPVMRHLREFEDKYNKLSYCLFIAPRMHQDTLNTFWFSTKYEYEGRKQRILPLTINQFNKVLDGVKRLHSINQRLSSKMLSQLLDRCTDTNNFSSMNDWCNSFDGIIDDWLKTIDAKKDSHGFFFFFFFDNPVN